MRALAFGALFIPAASLAAQAPGPLPHQCSIFAACEDGPCVRVHVPASITMGITDAGPVLLGTSHNPVLLGQFDSLLDAERYLQTDGHSRDFGFFIVPYDGVADALGWELFAVQSQGGQLSVSSAFTRLICSSA